MWGRLLEKHDPAKWSPSTTMVCAWRSFGSRKSQGRPSLQETAGQASGFVQAVPGVGWKICGKWKGRTSETSWKASWTHLKSNGQRTNPAFGKTKHVVHDLRRSHIIITARPSKALWRVASLLVSLPMTSARVSHSKILILTVSRPSVWEWRHYSSQPP